MVILFVIQLLPRFWIGFSWCNITSGTHQGSHIGLSVRPDIPRCYLVTGNIIRNGGGTHDEIMCLDTN